MYADVRGDGRGTEAPTTLFKCPFTDDDIQRAVGAVPTPRMFANATYAGVKAALVYRQSYLKPVLQGLLGLTRREETVLGLHYRMVGVLASLQRLDAPIHFQAIAAAARSALEIGLDTALLGSDATPDSEERVAAFTRVERYKVALRTVTFYVNRATPKDLSVAEQRRVCEDWNEASAVRGLLDRYWGPQPTGKCNWPKHWSRYQDTRARAKVAGGPWEERYIRYYGMLSWHLHGGYVGADGLSEESFDTIVGEAHRLVVDVVLDTYRMLGTELKLAQAIPEWPEHLQFLSQVVGFALVDQRLGALGLPRKFGFVEPHEEL